jgi:hypothetical protein
MTQQLHAVQPTLHVSPPRAGGLVHRQSWVARLLLLLSVGAVLSACGGGDDAPAAAGASSSGSAQEAATTAPGEAPPATTAAPAPQTTEAAPAAMFDMPDFVGLDLQTAQDMVQTNGVWLSVSHDLLGSRNQVVDSNWLVCTQNIPAGQQVSAGAEGEIDFGVVKREERCP